MICDPLYGCTQLMSSVLDNGKKKNCNQKIANKVKANKLTLCKHFKITVYHTLYSYFYKTLEMIIIFFPFTIIKKIKMKSLNRSL